MIVYLSHGYFPLYFCLEIRDAICNKNDEIYYSDYLKKCTKFLFLNEINKVGETINKYTKKGDFILIKGSRCWHLEKVIKSID